MRIFLVLLPLILFPLAAAAQVVQSGTITPGHAAAWATDGVLRDAGTAAAGALSTLGITGTGTPFCINSASTSSPTGYNQFCLGLNGTAATISVQNYGSATALPIKFTTNGVTALQISATGDFQQTLAAGKLLVGSASNIATPVTMTGVCSLTSAGVISCPGLATSNATLTVAGTTCQLGGSCWAASGTSSTLATLNGTATAGHCVQFDSSGNLADAGAGCGGAGGSGTVSVGSANQVAYYPSTAALVAGSSNLTINTSTVGFGAGILRHVRVVTAAGAVTVAVTDDVICVNKTSGAATAVNLPSGPTTGQAFVIKDCKGDARTNNITITPASGTIDGAATLKITHNYQSINVVYNGSEWSAF